MSRFTRAKLHSRLITLEIASFNVKPSKVEVPRRLTRKPHSMRRPFIIVLGMAALMFAATKLVLVAGVDPHTGMAWSGHRTADMLRYMKLGRAPGSDGAVVQSLIARFT